MKHIMNVLWLLCVCMVAMADNHGQRTVTLRGRITDAVDGSPVVGASIYFPLLKTGTLSTADGSYQSPQLPAVRTTVQVSYVGHQTILVTVDLRETTVMDFQLQENNAMLGEVVVQGLAGQSLAARTPSPVSVVSPERLARLSSTNIVDALSHEPGMASLTTGAGIAKPVIRGLGYNRVVVVSDGVRQEGQQWGDEHGVEVDAAGVHSVEILKGPATLMYGSDAMAGVVVMQPQPVMADGQMGATLQGELMTGCSLVGGSVDFAGNRSGVVWDWRLSARDASDYRNARDGHVPGTWFSEQAAQAMVGTNRAWGYSHLKLSVYKLHPGLPAAPGDDEESRQRVAHYKAVSDNSLLVGDGQLKLTAAYQQNRRRELEDGVPGLDFRLHTVTYDARFLSADVQGLSFSAGVGGMWQRSQNLGTEFLIPAYRLLDAGLFATATLTHSRLTLSGGLRGDVRRLHSYALREEPDDPEWRFDDFRRTFSGVSGSLGAICQLSAATSLRLNVSRGYRAPNLSELASNGEHEGTFRYEVGNSRLHPEHSWQADAGLDLSTPVFSMQLSLFASHIGNYIFLEAIDGGHTFGYRQGTARLWGGEAVADLHLLEPLHFENTFAMVTAVQLHQPRTSYLPFTPAPRWTSNLRYDLVRDGRVLNNTYLSVGLEQYFRQNHVHEEGGTESASRAYLLLYMGVGTDLRSRYRTVATVRLSVSNLTDRAYQSHLSRLRYAGTDPATGREGWCDMGRSVSLSLSVPISL